jgi:hypothetical protein
MSIVLEYAKGFQNTKIKMAMIGAANLNLNDHSGHIKGEKQLKLFIIFG